MVLHINQLGVFLSHYSFFRMLYVIDSMSIILFSVIELLLILLWKNQSQNHLQVRKVRLNQYLLMYNESKCTNYLTSTFCLFTSQGSSISSSSSNPSTPNSIKSTYQPPSKKRKKLDDVDIVIIDSLKGIEASRHQAIKDDEHELFGHQIAATLCPLSHKQKAVCKLQMRQILVNIEFPDKHTQQHYHYEQSFNNC